MRLVRRVYGALPHKANCERVFSYSGGVRTFKRDSLNWAKVERLVRVPYSSATGRLEVSARAAYDQYAALHAEGARE
jgi:hypothetical protein